MTLTMTPTTRQSSSTRTMSFDLRSAHRHRVRWGPLPVWPELFGASVVRPEAVWRIASRWQRETNATRLRALR
jgi:hypothetical protein